MTHAVHAVRDDLAAVRTTFGRAFAHEPQMRWLFAGLDEPTTVAAIGDFIGSAVDRASTPGTSPWSLGVGVRRWPGPLLSASLQERPDLLLFLLLCRAVRAFARWDGAGMVGRETPA